MGGAALPGPHPAELAAMSFSDCPLCWDTPCECGHYGYVVVRDAALAGLPAEEFQRIKRALLLRLAQLLDEQRRGTP